MRERMREKKAKEEDRQRSIEQERNKTQHGVSDDQMEIGYKGRSRKYFPHAAFTAVSTFNKIQTLILRTNVAGRYKQGGKSCAQDAPSIPSSRSKNKCSWAAKTPYCDTFYRCCMYTQRV